MNQIKTKIKKRFAVSLATYKRFVSYQVGKETHTDILIKIMNDAEKYEQLNQAENKNTEEKE